MKKIVASILSVLYLATSTGATINFHYCMGKLISWDILSPVDQRCSNCGMTKENRKGCCHDKQQTLQIKKDQLASSLNTSPDNNFLYLNTKSFSPVKFPTPLLATETYSVHGPPGLKTISPLILNCVFRL